MGCNHSWCQPCAQLCQTLLMCFVGANRKSSLHAAMHKSKQAMVRILGASAQELEGTSACLLGARLWGCLELSAQHRKNWVESGRVLLHGGAMHHLNRMSPGEEYRCWHPSLSKLSQGSLDWTSLSGAPQMGMQRQAEQSLFLREAWAINEDHMADKGGHCHSKRLLLKA